MTDGIAEPDAQRRVIDSEQQPSTERTETIMAAEASATNARKNGKNDLDSDFGQVNAQIDQLRKDFAELSRTLAATGAHTVDKAEHDIIQSSQEAVGNVAKEIRGIEADLVSQIRDYPVRSIGIAAGIGFLAAMLTRH